MFSIKSIFVIVIVCMFNLGQANAQTISFQRDFVSEFHYQNIPDLTIDFQKYRLQYKFEKLFLVQLNTESWSYNDIFSNKIDYMYVGFGVGVYVPIIDQLHTEFGIAHQIALKRSFERNNRLPTAENKGSISDIEKGRSFLFGSINYDIYLYKKIGLNLGFGV